VIDAETPEEATDAARRYIQIDDFEPVSVEVLEG
jgi:hypothetical protein